MSRQHYVIVIADDDTSIKDFLWELLTDEGYQVRGCSTGTEAMRVIQRIKPDLVLVDMQMEVHDAGLRVLQQMRQGSDTANISVIICSADPGSLEHNGHHIAQYGAEALAKPFDIDHLLHTVHRLLVAIPE